MDFEKKRLMISLVLGLSACIFMSLFVWRVSAHASISHNNMLAKFGGEKVEVLVAAKDIKPGELITKDNTKVQTWVLSLLSADVIDQNHMSAALNHRASEAIYEGEPLREKRINKQEHTLDKLPEGFSAVTVATDPVRALGGEIEIGMRVSALGLKGANEVEVLAPQVEIVSTSATSEGKQSSSMLGDKNKSNLSWVTLSVPDEFVSAIVSSAARGDIYLIMPDDIESFIELVKELEASTEVEANLEEDESEVDE